MRLSDAPLSVKPAGVADELLIVHQQDIQAVVNALWTGGAEAMTIQSQRVTSRTGVKCVGNSVVLHGVPYAPPYEIVAIGDQARLEQALADSAAVTIYRQYVDAYGLGFSQRRGTPRLPVHRVVLVLEEVGAGLTGEAVRACGIVGHAGLTPRRVCDSR